jgi:hypothetical protein
MTGKEQMRGVDTPWRSTQDRHPSSSFLSSLSTFHHLAHFPRFAAFLMGNGRIFPRASLVVPHPE